MKYKISTEIHEDGSVTHSISSPALKAKNLTMPQVWKMIQLLEGKEVMQFEEGVWRNHQYE